MHFKSKDIVSKVIFWILLVISTLWVIHPIIWMVLSSVKPEGEIFTRGLSLPTKITFDAYYWVLGLGTLMDPQNPYKMTAGSFPFYDFFRNGLVPGVITAIIDSILALFAGYSLARYKDKGIQLIGLFYLSLQFMPAILFFVPWYIMFYTMGLLDSYAALILVYIATTLPWSIWILRSFVEALPRDLEEAAFVDGCSRFQVIYKVVLPLTAPGAVAVALFAFTSAWNSYLPGLIISTSIASKPISVGLAEMMGFYGRTYWGGIMAASTLTSLPVAIIFVYLQKWMVRGLTAGAVKA